MNKNQIVLLSQWMYVVPCFASGITSPLITKYYIGEADVTLISITNALAQMGVMIGYFGASNDRMMRWFEKIFSAILVIVCLSYLVIALAGPNQIELRFYLITIADWILLPITSKVVSKQFYTLLDGDEMFKYNNGMGWRLSLAKFIGAGLSTMVVNIDIQIFLWSDVVVNVICCIGDWYTVHVCKTNLL